MWHEGPIKNRYKDRIQTHASAPTLLRKGGAGPRTHCFHSYFGFRATSSNSRICSYFSS